jgi:acyl-CoA synthetase (AMP-forming)/AMP-acid ligase II/acyl carrier protein
VLDRADGRTLTIPRLIALQSARNGDAPALAAPGREPLTYRGLSDHMTNVARSLRAIGVGRASRVAVVLPNGPEMASAFVAVASCAVCAPLNPDLVEAEYRFSLQSVKAAALVVPHNTDSPAVRAAEHLGIRILRVHHADRDPAGVFSVGSDSTSRGTFEDSAESSHVALLLHTSGTTAKPKLVPLTHGNLCHSALKAAELLRLDSRDRCLNVMPLFHIHGLAVAVLTPLASGGSVVCTAGVRDQSFLTWLRDLRPTWYTAAPTFHLAVAEAASRLGRPPNHALRFIRSASAALPPELQRRLEELFAVPVVQVYAMTESASLIAGNPLPPGERRLGSVGLPCGSEVRIVDPEWRSLQPGQTGEIVIRGPCLIAGYEDHPDANAQAFRDGWFRTGDEGRLDPDGYIFVTGRVSETINRGGEKVSPWEIDQVLARHPGVREAFAFPVPHPTLGEDAVAAVVLDDSQAATEAQLRDFAAAHLGPSKVPSEILIVAQVPKGPSGKVKRRELAGEFAHLLRKPFVPPRNDFEAAIASAIADVLMLERVGVDDSFFALGGDSLRATQVLARLNQTFHLDMPISALMRRPTVAGLAAELAAARALSSAALSPPGQADRPRRASEKSPVLTAANRERYRVRRKSRE